ncbi:fringe [Carabus blaptoides fortunei]
MQHVFATIYLYVVSQHLGNVLYGINVKRIVFDPIDYNDGKMSVLRVKRSVQTLTLAMILVYTTLLLYQSLSRGLIQSSQQIVRDVNSIMAKDYEEMFFENNRIMEVREKRMSVDKFTSDITPSVTATKKPTITKLEDLFISVKTTKHYHYQRLPIIIKTWFQLAKHQTWFFTDVDDREFQEKTNGHMVNTNCSSSHNRKALCCKMSVELDTFLESDKKWFCHFDDDNYVNVPRLIRLLEDYNSQEDWYLGKPSIRAPLELLNKEKNPQKISFWFATGGAGFCVSRALALKMIPIASAGKFISTGEKIRLPDDVTMGYIIEHKLKKPLTVVDQFHSHLEPMKFLRRDTLYDQISFSYSRNKDEWNVVKIEGFDIKYDPNRFLSLHCHLFPYFSFCPR